MAWWIWVVIGIVLLCSEIFIPLDFFLIFIGLGFLTTGGFVYFDLLGPDWLQWTACAVFTVIFYVGLKKKIINNFKVAVDRKEDYVGETVTIKTDIEVGQVGKGDLRGTGWQVKNISGQTLVAGSKHEVKKTDGIVLIVE